MYFTLGDADGALPCVFFRRENRGVRVEEGEQVLVHGRVSLWAERGELQLYVDALQPEGLGVQQAEFERLRRQLEAEGLFDPGRKRRLPAYPRAIGVATSPAGAVWHDVQTVLARRWPPAGLVLAPCRVQGDGAPESIVQAIEALNAAADGGAPIDVLIVARGGGSAEDLAAFNSEIVVRAAYASVLPLVSAVGHETDVTLIDFVADVRAPTPSAAAELVAPDRAEEAARLRERREALGRAIDRTTESARFDLDAARGAARRRGARLRFGAPAPRRAAGARLGSRAGAGRDGAAGPGRAGGATGHARPAGHVGARLRDRRGCERRRAQPGGAVHARRSRAPAPARRVGGRAHRRCLAGRDRRRGWSDAVSRAKQSEAPEPGDAADEPAYEQLVARLEETLARLESGDLPLEEALAAYEQGATLASRAQELLDRAEQRIQELRELDAEP